MFLMLLLDKDVCYINELNDNLESLCLYIYDKENIDWSDPLEPINLYVENLEKINRLDFSRFKQIKKITIWDQSYVKHRINLNLKHNITLDFKHNIYLEELSILYCKIDHLNLYHNQKLKSIYLSEIYIKNLNLSNNTQLEYLNIKQKYDSEPLYLDLTNNNKLNDVNFDENIYITFDENSFLEKHFSDINISEKNITKLERNIIELKSKLNNL